MEKLDLYEPAPKSLAEDDQTGLFGIIYGYRASVTLFTANEVGVFDRLAQGPATVAQVAQDCRCHPRTIEQLLNGCAAIGLVEKEGNLYKNSPLADAYLVEGKPISFRHHVSMQFLNYGVWTRLIEAVKTNQPLSLDLTTTASDRDLAMARRTGGFYEAVMILGGALPEQVDLTGRKKLFVCGPAGFALTIALVEKTPGLRGIILDGPQGLEASKEYIARHNLVQRIELRAGDYLRDDFGSDNDVVVLCQALQAGNEATANGLLKKAYESLVSGGLVGIVGYMVDPTKTAPLRAALWSLHMLCLSNGGRAYSTQEYVDWLAETGFVEPRLLRQPPPRPFWMMIARKP